MDLTSQVRAGSGCRYGPSGTRLGFAPTTLRHVNTGVSPRSACWLRRALTALTPPGRACRCDPWAVCRGAETPADAREPRMQLGAPGDPPRPGSTCGAEEPASLASWRAARAGGRWRSGVLLVLARRTSHDLLGGTAVPLADTTVGAVEAVGRSVGRTGRASTVCLPTPAGASPQVFHRFGGVCCDYFYGTYRLDLSRSRPCPGPCEGSTTSRWWICIHFLGFFCSKLCQRWLLVGSLGRPSLGNAPYRLGIR